MALTFEKLKLGLKAMFDELKKEEEHKFTDAKLNDGVTVVSWDGDSIDTGTIVYIVDSQGNQLPLPAGSYILEDGTTFDIVDDQGTADNVVEAGADPDAAAGEGKAGAGEPAPAGDMGSEKTQNTTTSAPGNGAVGKAKSIIKTQITESHYAEIKESFAKIKEENETIKAVFTKDVSELKEKFEAQTKELSEVKDMFSKLTELLESIAGEPAAGSPDTKKDQFKKYNPKEQKEAFKADLKKWEAKALKEADNN